MQFFRFFVSNMRIRASVLLIYSIRFLKFTFSCKLPTGSNAEGKNRRPKTGRRFGSGSVYTRLAQKPSNIVAIWSRVALPCGARKT